MFKVLLAVALFATVALALSEPEYEAKFVKWVTEHKKVYKHDEFFQRYHNFKKNVDIIAKHNSMQKNYVLGTTNLADLSKEEFAKKYLGYKPNPNRKRNVRKVLAARMAPPSLDWQLLGKVTPVKDQGQCGSCYSFSATGAMEGAWAIAKNLTGPNVVSISEEQVVDCSSAQGNQGCNGGLMDQVFQYVISNNGICSEQAYPYTAGGGQAGNCQTGCTPVVTISKFTDVAPNNEDAMVQAIQNGPLSVAIEADQSVFQLYTSGVIAATAGCGTQLDHGVLAVGYGVDPTTGLKFWRIKNSWNSSWGNQGYVLLERGNAAYPSGTCGVASDPSYPR
jgi:C1A family cysteine protease